VSGIPKALLAEWKANTLDIRQTGNGRWYDQKITPDIVAMICDVIVAYCNDSSNDSFTIKDLWHSPAFKKSMRNDFGKPAPSNPGSGREYDKVLGQPLNVLHSARLLEEFKPHPKEFRVNPEFWDFLCKLADSERESVEFLASYVEQVLSQSNLHGLFDAFFMQQDGDSFAFVKKGYADFMIAHTSINTEVECNRIFTKVLNIQAYARGKRGAERGRLSQDIISLDKIRYNQLNPRDIADQKPKHVPRKQSSKSVRTGADNVKNSRTVQRTTKDVKTHHSYLSEIQDQHAATPTKFGVQGHHIFPRSKYPALARFRENIIVLSATQHTAHAHDGPHAVSESYQQLCLLKKLDAVKQCDNDPNCNFYSFSSFKKMLALVGILNATNGGLDAKARNHLSYDDVQRIIVVHYSGAK